MKLPSIVLIGSGNVAFHLLRMFYENEIPVAQICGRNLETIQEFSNQFNIEYCKDPTQVKESEVYIICVSDGNIKEVATQIPYKGALIVHTAGSVSIDEIETERKGVLYPLQTFSKNRTLNYKEIPFFVEANYLADENILKNICQKISNKVHLLTSQDRIKLHLAAVWLCNYTNFNAVIAQEILNEAHISFEILKPLLDETFEKLQTENPIYTQTGPAKRNDITILEKHKALMKNKNYKDLYEKYYNTIVAYYHNK